MKKISGDTSPIRLLTEGSTTIDGQNFLEATAPYASFKMVSTGSEWFLLP